MSTHRRVNGSRLLPVALIGFAALASACGASSNKQAATAPAAAVSGASVSAAVSASPAPVAVTASPAAASAPASSPAAAAAVQAQIANVAFPEMITVKPGTTVTWTNKDSFAHTVTADAGQTETFDSKSLDGGGTFSVTFAKAGTFSYHCNIHSSMHGKVVVSDTAGGVASPAATPAKSVDPGYKY